MKMLMAALLASGATLAPALAADAKVDPERKGLLVSIIEDLGCRVDGVKPPKEFLDAMQANNFVREETKAIAAELVDEGAAERDGADLILKTENCS